MDIMAEEKLKWMKWNRATFNKAKKEKKPVLLDIYGVWCHWCHVAQNTTYANKNVIKMINSNFIPIKVDTDRRPDINERYNQGGWPTTAILTARGEFITGGTYFPPHRMLELLELTKRYYDEKKMMLESKEIKEQLSIKEVKGKISQDIIPEIVTSLTGYVDYDYGGFGIQPKFPFPELMELFINQYKKTKDKKLLKVITLTLDGMLGIYDGVEGGFFRYSVTREWSVPHFEKLLETNTKLVVNYIHAFEITKNEKYKEIAEGVLDYIENNLLDKKKFYFYGSQDADEEYYKLGANKREVRKKPHVDKTLFVNLNCYAIMAFLEAARVLEDKKYEDIALKVISHLLKNCKQNGMCHYYDGKPFDLGLLTDQVPMILALAKACKITKNNKYLKEAERLVKYVKKNFMHSAGVFLDRIVKPTDVGYLKQRNVSLVDNLLLSQALTKLSELTENKEYKKMAERILIYFSDKHQNYGLYSGQYALTLQKYFGS